MLTEIRIRNFAIIESVSLPLAAGFNVLSGETGAGKSIIVGALGFLLGERGSTETVRPGADKSTVEGVFEVGERGEIARWADERGIEIEGGTLILKRELASSGRGRAWINAAPVTAGTLAELGRLLVAVHGQHETQTLLESASQRAILDAFAQAEDALMEVRRGVAELSDTRARIADLTARRAEAARREDYLRHVAAEVEGAQLTLGEDEKIEAEASVLEHAAELRTHAAELADALSEDGGGALERIAALRRIVASITRIDSTGAELEQQLEAGVAALEELGRAAVEYAERIDMDPERLAAVRERREQLYGLTRKYGPAIGDVIEAGQQARSELDLLDAAGFDSRQLEEREKELALTVKGAAEKLSKLRRSAAVKLTKSVDALLPDLGLSQGRFSVVLEKLPETTAQGDEAVVFHVALNPGHPPRPVARVASGGELSRVMLALETVLARAERIPTLVFDEVDAGIGGAVALQVGDLLRRVALHHQVFAISHLPQLAARAHHHIVVAKGAKGGVTTADVEVVEGTTRVDEIARMLGGDPSSKISRAHAKELLESG